jgi:hypothetical protein
MEVPYLLHDNFSYSYIEKDIYISFRYDRFLQPLKNL